MNPALTAASAPVQFEYANTFGKEREKHRSYAMPRPTLKSLAGVLAVSVGLMALAPAAGAFNPQPEPPAKKGLKQKVKRFDAGKKGIIVIENKKAKKAKPFGSGKKGIIVIEN